MAANSKQVEQYQKLKREAISVKEKLDQAQGKEEQILEDLLKVAGCDTVEEAEDILEALNDDIDKREASIEKLHTKIRKDYPQLSKER